MPSNRSPSDMSFSSAKALSTLSMRFSSRTPVCTRSTSVDGGDGLRSVIGTNVPWYISQWQAEATRCCHYWQYLIVHKKNENYLWAERAGGTDGAEVVTATPRP